MRKEIVQPVKLGFVFIAVLLTTISYEQQNIITDKDNTRSEVTSQFNGAAGITSFTASPYSGYNEIQWSGAAEQDTRRFIVEYSGDGINFQSAGEAIAKNGKFLLIHQTFDIKPLFYRVRVEDQDAKVYYTQNILLEGSGVQAVKIYPTSISGNVVNAVAGFPIERITVFTTSGRQVFAQDMGGIRNYMSIVIPSLNRGMYWMTFWGKEGKTTSTFIVP